MSDRFCLITQSEIDEAYDTEGRQESIVAWQRVFGDEFAKGAVVKAAADSAFDGAARIRNLMSSTAAHLNEIVDVVRNFGLSILPEGFSRPPHIKPPRWRQLPQLAEASVVAEWRSNSASQGWPTCPGEILPPRGGLYFRASMNGGGPIPVGFQVQWRTEPPRQCCSAVARSMPSSGGTQFLSSPRSLARSVSTAGSSASRLSEAGLGKVTTRNLSRIGEATLGKPEIISR